MHEEVKEIQEIKEKMVLMETLESEGHLVILDPLEEREITEVLVPPEVEDRREVLANRDNPDNQVARDHVELLVKMDRQDLKEK